MHIVEADSALKAVPNQEVAPAYGVFSVAKTASTEGTHALWDVVKPEISEPRQGDLGSMYSDLRDRSLLEYEAGHLDAALQLSEDALSLAEQINDEDLLDQAYCNRYGLMLLIHGDTGQALARLRAILMRNRGLGTSFSAAYYLACSYTERKFYKKALFYAQIARDRALAANETAWQAKSRNEMGRCFLSESFFDRAIEEYESALKLLPEEAKVLRAVVLGNLGYARLMTGDTKAGFRRLFSALRLCRRNTEESIYEAWIRLYLCYGYSEENRWTYAWQHGFIGLRIADAVGDQDAIKNALYLLGEVEKSAGDMESAYLYYSRLQREFYPNGKDLPELMLHFGTKQLVNLRA